MWDEGKSDTEVVSSIYQALFGREPDAEGLDFFLTALADGTQTFETIAINILDGARDEDVTVINNRIEAANLFTASLDTPEEIAAYVGEAAAEFGRQFVSTVTGDPQTVPTPEEVQEQIDTDLPDFVPPDGGQEPEPPPEPSPTFTMTADPGGVVTFGGTASGTIAISSIVMDGDDATITAVRQGVTITRTFTDFDSITAAAGQNIRAGADVVNGLALDLTGGARLTVDVTFPDLDLVTQELPGYDISGIEVNGVNGPEAIWDSVSVRSGDIADKFKLFWVSGDGAYYNVFPDSDVTVNEANVQLGNIYVDHLLDDNPAIMDIVQTKVSGNPNFVGRQQSLHDNLLVNLIDGVIASRFGTDPGDDPRSDAAKEFGGRPEYSGNFAQTSGTADRLHLTRVWDATNGVERPDLVGDVLDLGSGADFTGFGFDWETDRHAPDSIAFTDTLAFNINGEGPKVDASAAPFDRYQGAKIAETDGDYLDVAHGGEFSVDFLIDPAWAIDNDAQASGVWMQLNTVPGDNRNWAIIEYLDADASNLLRTSESLDNGPRPAEDFTGFRIWDTDSGWAHYIPMAEITPDAAGWVEIGFSFEDGAYVWSINGETVYTDTGAVADSADVIETVLFNSINFGEDETYQYDNISLTGITLNKDLLADVLA